MHFTSKKLAAYPVYLLVSAIGSFAMCIISTISSVYLFETVRLNPLQLVLVGTMLEGVTFLCQVPTGVLADAYSRRLSILIGYSLMGAGFLLEGLVPTFFAALLAQILWGCGFTFVNGAEEAWVADEIGGDVGKVLIQGTQFGQVAALVAIPLSIWLATFHLNLPIIVGGGTFLALGFFLLLAMPERHFVPTSQVERTSWRTMANIMIDGGAMVRRKRMLLYILAITAFGAMASEGFDRLQTPHFLQDYTFPALGHLSSLAWFGIISAGSMLLVLVATVLAKRYIDTNNQRAIIATLFACNMLLIVSVAAFALARNFSLALLAFWCASVFRRIDTPFYNTWLIRNSDARTRATVISMFGQVDAIGQIVGGPVVGVIGNSISLRAALLTTCGILMPNGLFFVQSLRLSQRASITTNPGGDDEETVPISISN